MPPGGHPPTSHIELEDRKSDSPTRNGTPEEKIDPENTARDVSSKVENKGTESDGTAPVEPISDPEHAEDDVENPDRPKGFSFAVVYTCILFGDFFTGYDSSCVGALTPVITNEFGSLDDVGWYGIAYLLAGCSTVLTFGQLYTLYPMKYIFITSFLVFAVGSAISAAAPSSVAFIIGRAVSGLGSAGVFSGGSIIVANTTSLKHRPIYQSISGGLECTALAVSPLLSGTISHYSSWRVAFYIIIPVCVANALAVFFFVHNIQRPEKADLSPREKFQQLDTIGFFIFVPMTVCIILGLQWGGIAYNWSNARIIVLLVLTGTLAMVFLYSQYRAGDNGMFPLKLLRQRSVALGAIFTFCMSACLFVVGYYLPIYFQAVRDATTLKSGLMYLPFAVAFAIAIMVAGSVTTFIGYYTPVMVIGSVLVAVGAGLITTFKVDTSTAKWAIYQILFGAGAGLAFQQPYTAVQTVLPEDKVATALVVLNFTQELGGIVALAISQNIFQHRLYANSAASVPGFDPTLILKNGITDLRYSVPSQFQTGFILAYNKTISEVFYTAVAFGCLTMIGAIGIEWKSVKTEKSTEELTPNTAMSPPVQSG
ncbi:putative efflux pump antibiotic resistance protein [Xylogone sp. PMI_703]|nr:putative efflux pump antibiotic resistance protein [Xylogone sp. PMI_703]